MPVVAEKRSSKGKDAKHVAEGAAHAAQPAFSPGPDLRRYQVNHGDALAMQLAREAQVEIGGIGEDGQVRTAFGRAAARSLRYSP